ncbi:MAG: hypothetical protein ACOY16_04720 [Chloroflexota bacterium]|jgi:hypothetical protein
MAKYTMYARQQPPKQRPWKVHPIWRGIGCVMIIIIPIMSYAGAYLLVEANREYHWVPMPYDLMKTVRLAVPAVVQPVLPLKWHLDVQHLYATLLVTGILIFIGFGVLMILYGIIYRITGPSFLTPIDAPPVRRERRIPRR